MGEGNAGNDKETKERIIVVGEPDIHGTDNSVHTSKYTIWTFLPIAIREQFRRNGNVYFLFMGTIMGIGWYTELFDSALTPWTTIGPLAIVVAISVTQEGLTDLSRHQSDTRTNQHPCVVLRRADELADGGDRDPSILHGRDVDVRIDHSYVDPSTHGGELVGAVESSESDSYSHRTKIAFQTVKRMNMYAGDLVLVRNREMIPADIILLASSSEGGNAYIETSSIDGETNLKLRTSPRLPDDVLNAIESRRTLSASVRSSVKAKDNEAETIEAATKRITRMSLLGHPSGVSALRNPDNETPFEPDQMQTLAARRRESQTSVFTRRKLKKNTADDETPRLPPTGYVAVLTSEPPNAAVNSYSGKLTLPPPAEGEPSPDIALGADNILLRGAVLRNTEWAIGIACFTGSDTKLVRNSTKTPSKFSRIDQLTNRTVLIILVFMVTCAVILSALYVTTHNSEIDKLFYVGFNTDTTEKWPYLPDLDAPDWDTAPQNFIQSFLLNMTLLNNFVPLSLYVTVEVIILAMMLFVALDRNMYHAETDTPAAARSTIVTDLGQVQYVFSDKTGTLTENVMRFKRCSVDGLVFGAPVEKATPTEMRAKTNPSADDVPPTSFHPLRQLLVSAASSGGGRGDPALDGLAGYGEVSAVDAGASAPPQTLTFNAEMFLRVMCLCHTVVVEKDFDTNIEATAPTESANSSGSKSLTSTIQSVVAAPFGLCRRDTTDDDMYPSDAARRDEEEGLDKEKVVDQASEERGSDGAPKGFAYQAESPDEGALVGAASLTYGFQVLGRDSAGIHLAVSSPSVLEDAAVKEGLKNGTLTPRSLAASTTATTAPDDYDVDRTSLATLNTPREETWQVLAVNKFDSDRKRMSIVVRSPPELGSLPIVFCKGADSSMLSPGVCMGAAHLMSEEEEEEGTKVSSMPKLSEDEEEEFINERGGGAEEANEWEMAAMLSIQAHLGDFASEGLRTLVLGMRVLTDQECDSWLKVYNDAATAIDGREQKLFEAALQIESRLHIVGATAIEDKLQDGVPDAIATLGNSGIKLWVLTGDKRETAIEIGYSTKVLTPEMHLTEVVDGPSSEVKTRVAMDFLRLVKTGALPQYQKAALQDAKTSALSAWWRRSTRQIEKFFAMITDAVNGCFESFAGFIRHCFGTVDIEEKPGTGEEGTEVKKDKDQDPIVRRRAVRAAADTIIAEYLSSLPESVRRRKSSVTTGLPPKPQGWKVTEEAVTPVEEELDEDEAAALASDAVPNVFKRASSAKVRLDEARQESRTMMNTSLRSLSIAAMTAKGVGDKGLVDEDTLSLKSFLPESGGDLQNTFDKKRRTVLERLFAVDRDVRKGRLVKHAKPQTQRAVPGDEERAAVSSGPRALVVEGAALLHLLGDPVMEEMIFSVASSCDAVIACRVSPKQKALLVNLVRNYVSPTPVTLAIGDGANDVGMIQAAHVGVGVSGKEGQQAVNASDFAIAQFRFLKDLVLVHGRWDYVRMSKVVLFSFYKNAVLAGLLVLYSGWGMYSGYPLFDSWVLSMLNFVAGFPILFLGIFDRDLERDYVLNNPDVHASGAQNEHLNIRMTMRYALFTVIHAVLIFYLSIPPLSEGGGATSAFDGLMHNDDRSYPGDGVGDDVKVVGLNVFTILIVHLAFKVLVESGSYIVGQWPSIRCREENHSFVNRVAWTFVGVSWLSIIFFLFGVYVYQVFGTQGASSFSPFTFVANHTYNTRSISWTLILLVPAATNVVDIAAKVFANTYFPMQSQIHREIQGAERGRTVLNWRRWTGMTAS